MNRVADVASVALFASKQLFNDYQVGHVCARTTRGAGEHRTLDMYVDPRLAHFGRGMQAHVKSGTLNPLCVFVQYAMRFDNEHWQTIRFRIRHDGPQCQIHTEGDQWKARAMLTQVAGAAW